MTSDDELALTDAGNPARRYKMSGSRASNGALMVAVTKTGRIGTSTTVAVRDATQDPPRWNDAGDAIRFAEQDWVPDDLGDAAAWMESFAESLEAVRPKSSSSARDAFLEDFGPGVRRWQYATVNTSTFSTDQRLADVLGQAGRLGWELVQISDKSSSWWSGMEKGFVLLRREVPPGIEPIAWSVQVAQTSSS